MFDNKNWKTETWTNRRRGKTKKVPNLKQHIKETESEASTILRKINGISSKQNVGQEEIRVKFKFFETCLAPTIVWSMAGDKIPKQSEMEAIEKIQNQSLKKILHLAVTTRQWRVIKRQWHQLQSFMYVALSIPTLAEIETW